MTVRVRLAISFVTIGAIATATTLWTRGRMSDKERERLDAQELMEQFAKDPKVKAMLGQAAASHEKEVSARRPVPSEMLLSARQIEDERPLLTEEIHAAFKNVSRVGGVSWSESDVIDMYGSAEERAAARALDKDTGWTQLVDEQSWHPDPGVGGFSFMDAIGFRYYLPAAMMRCVRSGDDEGIQFHLALRGSSKAMRTYNTERVSALDQRQRQCVARFLRYMVAVSALQDAEHYEAKAWLAALDSNWAEAK